MAAVVMEEWRQIDGHPGYEVSSLGGVRSAPRTIASGNRWGRCLKKIKGKDLQPWPVGAGYLVVGLGAGQENREYIHHLVAAAFVPPADDTRRWINHRDGVKTNNRASNLEWVSRAENCLHATHVLGLRGGQFGPNRTRYPAGTCL